MKRMRWITSSLVLVAALTACALLPSPATPASPATTVASQPPAETAPAPTAEPPTQPPVTAPPAAASQPIAPLAPGDKFVFRRISMDDGLHGWAIASAAGIGHLLRTEDGGQTWTDVSPPNFQGAGDPPQAELIGAFPMYRQAWVSYFQSQVALPTSTVWWTDFAGQEWTPGDPLTLPAGGTGLQPLLAAADESHALYVADVMGADGSANVTAFSTADGGASWQSASLHMCQPTGLALAADGRAWLTESCLGGADISGVEPSLWQSEDGGVSWQGVQLSWQDLAMDPPDIPSSCRTDDPNLFDGGGALAVNCFSDADPGASTAHAVARWQGSWQGWPSPAGQLLFLDERYSWKLDKMIFHSSDGGQNWSLINQVSWDGAFDFIDRWRGWAVATSGEDNALVRTTDGGRSYQLLEPTLLPRPDGQSIAGCQLNVSGSPTAYTRPSYAAEPFGSLPGGMPVYLEARTPDGWLGFDPGVAQAANIGVFHNRWLPPDTEVTFEGDCDNVPVVEGPLPGVCYEMVMGQPPVYQSADPSSPILITATTGEYMVVRSQDANGWIQVDLGFGNIGLDLQGWMEPSAINWNGPCPPGG